MKKYFYIILINVHFRPTGTTRIDSQKVFQKGLIEIEMKEDTASLIYEKIFKKEMTGWIPSRVIATEVEFFNFWEEKETLEDSNLKTVIEIEKILNRPITIFELNLATLEQLEKRGFRTWRDIASMTEKGLKFLDFSEIAICNIKKALSVHKLKLAK